MSSFACCLNHVLDREYVSTNYKSYNNIMFTVRNMRDIHTHISSTPGITNKKLQKTGNSNFTLKLLMPVDW